jgi:hypothetical protein
MLDPSQMSEEEQKLVEEVAQAKGQTVEETLAELGHELPRAAEQDETVSLESAGDSVAVSEPIVVEAEEAVTASEVPDTGPSLEPPPPPAAEEEGEESEPDNSEELKNDEELPATLSHNCQHCGWDSRHDVIEEPTKADKLSFLQSILGGATFSKRYSLFGGNLRVTFRTLTIKEIDKLYEAAYAAQKSGLIATTSDYYEYLNRLRLHLQLTSVTGKNVPLHHKLPDGLSMITNNSAKSNWVDFLKEKKVYDEDKTLALQIQEYVLDNILKTEQLLRVVTFECQKFNRLASKLEARVDDPDFWNETGQPS